MATTPPRDVIAAAQASQVKYGIPASISLAQWAVESAWGKRMPPGSSNPFGIKALTGQPSVTVPTREVDKAGRSYTINAAFRAFASLGEAFDAHGKLLAEGRPYAAARRKLPNADAFADALTGVYATDPNYGDTLKSVMRGSNLYRYDAGSSLVPGESAKLAPQGRVSATDRLNEASLAAARGG